MNYKTVISWGTLIIFLIVGFGFFFQKSFFPAEHQDASVYPVAIQQLRDNLKQEFQKTSQFEDRILRLEQKIDSQTLLLLKMEKENKLYAEALKAAADQPSAMPTKPTAAPPPQQAPVIVTPPVPVAEPQIQNVQDEDIKSEQPEECKTSLLSKATQKEYREKLTKDSLLLKENAQYIQDSLPKCRPYLDEKAAVELELTLETMQSLIDE